MRDDLKTDLNDARHHMKAALRSTLVAVRGAMDAAIDKLDDDATAKDEPTAEPAPAPDDAGQTQQEPVQ